MSEDSTKYNGWTNYETWCVKLWLDNEEWTCNDVMPELARQNRDTYKLSKAIEEFVTDPENGLIPDVTTGIGGDLLGHALGMVDWYEIAENILEDNDYAEEEETEDVTE